MFTKRITNAISVGIFIFGFSQMSFANTTTQANVVALLSSINQNLITLNQGMATLKTTVSNLKANNQGYQNAVLDLQSPQTPYPNWVNIEKTQPNLVQMNTAAPNQVLGGAEQSMLQNILSNHKLSKQKVVKLKSRLIQNLLANYEQLNNTDHQSSPKLAKALTPYLSEKFINGVHTASQTQLLRSLNLIEALKARIAFQAYQQKQADAYINLAKVIENLPTSQTGE